MGVGEVVARLAAVQVLAVDRPEHPTRLPVPRFPNPLGAEPICSRPLRSLRHRDLTPRLLGLRQAALRDAQALLVPRFGLGRAPASVVGWSAPGRLQRPDWGVRRNVQDVLHPLCRQTISEPRGHPKRVVPRGPPGAEAPPCPGLPQHLQRQVGLRPVPPLDLGSRPPSHSGRDPRSISPADTGACPLGPARAAPRGPETPRPGN